VFNEEDCKFNVADFISILIGIHILINKNDNFIKFLWHYL